MQSAILQYFDLETWRAETTWKT